MNIHKVNEDKYQINKGVQGINFSLDDFVFIKKAVNIIYDSVNKSTLPEYYCSSLRIFRVETVNQNTPSKISAHFYIEDHTDFKSLSVHDLRKLKNQIDTIIKKTPDKKFIDDSNVDSDAWSVSVRNILYQGELYPLNVKIYYIDLDNDSAEVEMDFTFKEFIELTQRINKFH